MSTTQVTPELIQESMRAYWRSRQKAHRKDEPRLKTGRPPRKQAVPVPQMTQDAPKPTNRWVTGTAGIKALEAK